MPLGRILFRELVALALLRHYLHNHRPLNVLNILKHIYHQRNIVSIKSTKELEAQFLKDGPALAVHHKLLETRLGSSSSFTRLIAHYWQLFNQIFCHFAQTPVALRGLHLAYFVQVGMQRTHVI